MVFIRILFSLSSNLKILRDTREVFICKNAIIIKNKTKMWRWPSGSLRKTTDRNNPDKRILQSGKRELLKSIKTAFRSGGNCSFWAKAYLLIGK